MNARPSPVPSAGPGVDPLAVDAAAALGAAAAVVTAVGGGVGGADIS